MSILLIDSYDSFTYNLHHYLSELSDEPITVVRNDKITVEEVESFDRIVLSPGPGLPKEAGVIHEVIRKYGAYKPILGVCLGHQAIAEVYGAELVNLPSVYHGVASLITLAVSDDPLFTQLPPSFEVGRYHSWVVSLEDLPERIEVTSYNQDGNIMSLRIKGTRLTGIQFHPESVLTPHGKQIINNWLTQ